VPAWPPARACPLPGRAWPPPRPWGAQRGLPMPWRRRPACSRPSLVGGSALAGEPDPDPEFESEEGRAWPPLARTREATSSSTDEDAAFTSTPASLRRARTSFAVRPRSLAIFLARFVATLT